MKKFLLFISVISLGLVQFSYQQNQPEQSPKSSNSFRIARLKYAGGGDWYNDPSAEVNIMEFLKRNTVIDVDESKFYSVDVSSDDIFNYPFILITGHGNINFSEAE